MEDPLLFPFPSLPYKAFETFINRYARAAGILLECWGISKKPAFQRVSINSRSWQKFKFMVKYAHLWLYSCHAADLVDHTSLKGLYSNAAALFDQSGLNYCLPIENIRRIYLTDVKYNGSMNALDL